MDTVLRMVATASGRSVADDGGVPSRGAPGSAGGRARARLARAGMLGAVMVAMAGCNTVAGLRKDIKGAGEAIEKSAR